MSKQTFNSDDWHEIHKVFEQVTDPDTGFVISAVYFDLKNAHYFDQFTVNTADDGRKVITHDDTGVVLTKDTFRSIFEPDRPHWFTPVIQESLEEKAFLEGNLTAQGDLIKQLGGGRLAVLQAETIAKKYGAKLGSTKRGTRPEDAVVKTETPADSNPWSNIEKWVDQKTGKYNAAAMRRQSDLLKSLGPQKAAGIAASAGAFIGATSPRSKNMTGPARKYGT